MCITVREELVLLVLGSLSYCHPAVAAAAVDTTALPLQCPSPVIELEDATSPKMIDLQAGNSYLLGSGTYVLNSTVEVAAADSALW
jgi:hypothetical protein